MPQVRTTWVPPMKATRRPDAGRGSVVTFLEVDISQVSLSLPGDMENVYEVAGCKPVTLYHVCLVIAQGRPVSSAILYQNSEAAWVLFFQLRTTLVGLTENTSMSYTSPGAGLSAVGNVPSGLLDVGATVAEAALGSSDELLCLGTVHPDSSAPSGAVTLLKVTGLSLPHTEVISVVLTSVVANRATGIEPRAAEDSAG